MLAEVLRIRHGSEDAHPDLLCKTVSTDQQPSPTRELTMLSEWYVFGGKGNFDVTGELPIKTISRLTRVWIAEVRGSWS